MGEVTGQAARQVGLGESWITGVTQGIPPLSMKSNPDGTVTLSFPSDVTQPVLDDVKRRMETRDDAELALRDQIRAALTALQGQEPEPDLPPDCPWAAWASEHMKRYEALLGPLACLFGMAPTP